MQRSRQAQTLPPARQSTRSSSSRRAATGLPSGTSCASATTCQSLRSTGSSSTVHPLPSLTLSSRSVVSLSAQVYPNPRGLTSICHSACRVLQSGMVTTRRSEVGSAMGIYVEIHIQGDMDELWQKTQQPDLHQQWDLRFTDIEYLPRPDVAQPQRFLYATRIGLGLGIRGAGGSTGSQEHAGQRVSALKFWSDDPKSLIAEGSGYWRYQQTPDGIRFLTWYDYRTRFGAAGRAFYPAGLPPLVGSAPARGFDPLRLWVQPGIPPARPPRSSLLQPRPRLGRAVVCVCI